MTETVLPERSRSVVWNVVRTVASAEQCDPTDLCPPLAAAVDPGALEAIVETADPSVRVRFTYLDRTVEVCGDGEVRLDPSAE